MHHALVTGATGNIGSAVVKSLRTDNVFDRWQITRLSRSGCADSTACDMGVWNAIDYTVERLPSELYDLVVYAHGITKITPLLAYREVDYQRVMNVNLMGCVVMTQKLLQHNLLAKNALLVFISSIHAHAPRAERGLYAMSKAGLEAFAKSFAQEYHHCYRAVALRLGQCNVIMQGVNADKDYMASRLLTPLLDVDTVADFIIKLYDHPGLTGCVLEYDGGQGRNIW